MSDPTIWDHLLAFLVGVGLPVQGMLGRPASMAGSELGTREKILTYWANGAVLLVLAGLAIAATLGRGDGLEALGLGHGHDVGGSVWILAVLLALYCLDLARKLGTRERRMQTAARWQEQTPFMPATCREFAHSTVMIASAALGEEILYRGFLVSYLLALFGQASWGPPAAVLVPATVFGATHRYQGGPAVAYIALLAAGFGWFFVRAGTIWPIVALHLVIDVVGCAMGPWLMNRAKTER